MTNVEKARAFVEANPNLIRKEYMAGFKDLGINANTASVYHYMLVRKPAKIKAQNRPLRDDKGRYIKRVA